VNRNIEPLAELKERIIAEGWNRKATCRVVSELLFNLAVALAGIWMFVVCDGAAQRTCAIIISTAGSMGVQPIPTHHLTTRRAGNDG